MTAKFPVPTRELHEKFCITENWTSRKSATGRRGTHHRNYELALPDGRILLTRISHPVDRTTYGASIWSHILRDQLLVTDSEFWECVHDGVLPNRGVSPIPQNPIPLAVINTLVNQVGLPEREVNQMTKEEAITRLAEFYRNGK